MGYRIINYLENGKQKVEYVYNCKHILDAIYKFYGKIGIHRINVIEEL